ncbi:hypothetical protein EDB92DRAFT_1985212 [Lactarius akahatsu]|uniref:Uncharacterized protein n=1 Tax=Lactarius akahatsu TaxID=416441 RepID=A0AAD4QHT0_9AGAM|nr:hypothetical protein EDB92DRAFT_1985212 [Lactarius akahatsu]
MGHFLSAPLRLDQGLLYRTLLPARRLCQSGLACYPVYTTTSHRLATLGSAPVNQNPGPKHASCIQSSVHPVQIRSRDGRVGWRDVALAMLCSEPQIRWWRPLWIKWLCGTHLSIGGRVVLAVTIAAQEACHTTNVQGPGKWRLPFCGYIYWAIRLFTGSSIRRPPRILSSFLLPAALAMAASAMLLYLWSWLPATWRRLFVWVLYPPCPIGLLVATPRTSAPRSRFGPLPSTAASSPRDLGSSYRA